MFLQKQLFKIRSSGAWSLVITQLFNYQIRVQKLALLIPFPLPFFTYSMYFDSQAIKTSIISLF